MEGMFRAKGGPNQSDPWSTKTQKRMEGGQDSPIEARENEHHLAARAAIRGAIKQTLDGVYRRFFYTHAGKDCVRDCSTRSARKMASAQCAPTMENITPRA